MLVVHVGYRAHIRIHPGGDTQRGNAQRLKVPCDADGKLHVDAALAQFVPDDAAGDGVVLAHKLAGAADDFRDEAHPGMETAAVAVAPLIGERRHERADQIPVRAVQLAGVKARFLGAAHGLRVIFDVLFDLAGFQHPGRVVFRLEYGMGFRLEIGRRDGLKTGCPGIGFPSGMVQLRGDEAIVAVHGLGEPAKAGDAGVVMNKNLSAEVAVRPDAEGTDDDHRHPASRAAFGIGDFRVADGTVFGHVHRHGRHDEPVFEAEGADGNGLEQWSVVHGGGSRKKGVSGVPRAAARGSRRGIAGADEPVPAVPQASRRETGLTARMRRPIPDAWRPESCRAQRSRRWPCRAAACAPVHGPASFQADSRR